MQVLNSVLKYNFLFGRFIWQKPTDWQTSNLVWKYSVSDHYFHDNDVTKISWFEHNDTAHTQNEVTNTKCNFYFWLDISTIPTNIDANIAIPHNNNISFMILKKLCKFTMNTSSLSPRCLSVTLVSTWGTWN